MAEPACVHRHYRRLTVDLRADHVAALLLLGRRVEALPTSRFVRRSFVVMTVAGH